VRTLVAFLVFWYYAGFAQRIPYPREAIMPIDAYSPCPGGSGKKVKHCSCCRDIVNDLEHIVKALEGGQRVAALDRINRVLATHANRPSLLSLKAATQLSLQEMQGFDETVAAFLQVAPNNPLALAYGALSKLKRGDVDEAVDDLQAALTHVESEIPRDMYETVGAVARALLDTGNYAAARAHYIMQLAMSRNEDERAIKAVLGMGSPEQVPPLLKQDRSFPRCPADATWAKQYEAALADAVNGRWARAIEQLQKLEAQAPQEPSILKSIAQLYMYLGKDKSVEYWRAFADCDGVPFEEVVEAEALIELLRGTTEADQIDIMQLTYPIKDTDGLMEKLLSDSRVSSVGGDPMQFAAEGEPPPKGVFWLLDRPMPKSGSDISVKTVPRVVADIIVHGKQTDREARLMLNISKDDRYDDGLGLLREIAGDLIGDSAETKTVGQMRREAVAMGAKAMFPDDTPIEVRRRAMMDDREYGVFAAWPKTRMAVLNEKTPEEATGDPALKAKLTALLLNLEQKCQCSRWDVDLNPLREKLGLPARASIDPTDKDVLEIPLIDLSRVEVEKLTDEQLTQLYETATLFGQYVARRRLATELIGRDTLEDEINKAELYGELADLASDLDEALEYLHKARDTAVAKGESPAMWLLSELRVRMLRQDATEAQELLNRIRTHHMSEPGISQALFEMLVQFGIITPQGQPTAAAMEGAQQAAGAPPAEATGDGKIWTPGGQPSAAEPKESKLWIPD
jgi:tetratricopeptide (TPR) repeat protein